MSVYTCVLITSTVRALVPAVRALGDSIAQFAHMDTHIWGEATVFIDRTLAHPVVRAWRKKDKHVRIHSSTKQNIENQSATNDLREVDKSTFK